MSKPVPGNWKYRAQSPDVMPPGTIGHRMLSAAQHLSNLTDEHGGASADLHSLRAYEYGENAHMASGTPDVRTGKAFPTQLVDVGTSNPKLSVGDVMEIRDKMRPAAKGAANPVFGTWVSEKDPKKGVQVDYATALPDKEKAKDLTLSRNEDAMFSMSDLSETKNEDIRTERGITGERPPKTKSQEEVFRRHGEVRHGK